jgi:hypothetical protein
MQDFPVLAAGRAPQLSVDRGMLITDRPYKPHLEHCHPQMHGGVQVHVIGLRPIGR